MRLCSRPLLVPLAASHTVSDQHVAVVALVGDQRVVAHGRVHCTAIQRIAGHLALDSCREAKNRHYAHRVPLRQLEKHLRTHSGRILGLHEPSAWQYLYSRKKQEE